MPDLRTLKMRIAYFIKSLLFYTGVFALLRRLRPNYRISILRYHAVVEAEKNDYASPAICISPRQFERHVRYFASRYRIITLDEAIAALRGERPVPPNAVVFTFDDGYADNFEAAKILDKYGASGIIYLTAACVDRQEPFWLAEVTYLPLRTKKPRLELQLGGSRLVFELSGTRQRRHAIRELVKMIKNNNRAFREDIRRQLRAQLADDALLSKADSILLTWEQVRQMQENGMLFGAHTMTHLNLPNADPPDAEQEISQCKRFLEAKLGCEVAHFSYPNSGPYAYFNQGIRDIVERSGYRSAVTSFQGFADHASDFFALRRVRTVPSLVETVAGIELARFGRG